MIPDRYNISNLKKALRQPSAIRDEGYRTLRGLYNRYSRLRYGEGLDVVSEDWDNLIILDACRYDYFVRQNTVPGELKPILSRGSHSWEFMEKNFLGRELHDTVYVTANPQAQRLPTDVFYTVESVHERWDEELGGVRPDAVVDAAIEANERYPDKRLIIHFMQPHRPWLGPTADRLRERVTLRGWDPDRLAHLDKFQDYQKELRRQRGGMTPWTAVREGHISIDEMRRAYEESLDIVLEHTEALIEDLDGKSVVTSDHGEMLGERITPWTRRYYGHPELHTLELRRVPWLETGGDDRRIVVPEEPIGFERIDESVLKERLRALGYVQEAVEG